jgi:hypothetical protein
MTEAPRTAWEVRQLPAGRQVPPQLHDVQALVIPDRAKRVRDRQHLAAQLGEDLRRPGAHVAKALRGAHVLIIG